MKMGKWVTECLSADCWGLTGCPFSDLLVLKGDMADTFLTRLLHSSKGTEVNLQKTENRTSEFSLVEM